MVQHETHLEKGTCFANLGHQDTCLAPERLNPKPTQVGIAGEGRHRKHRPEGTQGKGAAWESGD